MIDLVKLVHRGGQTFGQQAGDRLAYGGQGFFDYLLLFSREIGEDVRDYRIFFYRGCACSNICFSIY